MKRSWLLALVLTGCGDAVVDGACADGYEICDGVCRPIGACAVDSEVPLDSSIDSDNPFDTGDASTETSAETSSDTTVGSDSSGDTLVADGADAFDAFDGCPPPPYTSVSNCGGCGVTCSGATPLCKKGLDGTYACGPVCDPPTTLCGTVCVDLDVDPNNCGSCGKMCPTGLCNGGKCRGAKAGHVVAIGHDYAGVSATLAVARVIVNAAFLPTRNPVRILSFEQYADAAAISSVKSILDGGAASTGRAYVKTSTTTLAAFRDALIIDDYDAALIFDQPKAPDGALATIGANLSITLDSFARVGGTIVILDGASGVGQMPQLLTKSTLLTTTSHTVVTGKAVDVVAPADAVGLGVLSPYSAPSRSVTFTITEPSSGSLVTVVSEPASAKPVVLHKVFFK